ncbi:hypothetical protein CROQUDRAFT_44013 [Cronartium quercuum f. sp. fusiforme G11]|uniref:RING-type domain-containing protein n=1 Tax=Cronartium quercuum f. sp. fusiforme G11 TaxID=708437 RepID=A0A9P6NNG8_9BASI|nr:hypothetical protein CROQUDRAFT_77462 [Cronartium quercuum f. sp. fusiforme G11]KAG0146701.1 hypothetical protein CROQUDRAFT_44013 [Cronartium quercuum f. sp. fusiforme G11]
MNQLAQKTDDYLKIDECFISPQRPNLKSERVKVKVHSNGQSLTVAGLKRAVVSKGYPSLSDPHRITLLLPIGPGILLTDDMMASHLPLEPHILALVSPTPNETLSLHARDGLNLPSILYVYTTSTLRAFIKMPHSIPFPHAGVWTGLILAWSITLEELAFHFTQLGFHEQTIWSEARRINEHYAFASGPFAAINPAHKGYLAPQLMFRLWDAAGLNKLAATQQRAITGPQSEFEVYTASCFSVESVSSVGTVRARQTVPPTIPSVIMASPSEHESAYDESFYQYLVPPSISAPTVSGSSDGTRSCASSEVDGMDWVLDQRRAASVASIKSDKRRNPFETSSRVSKLLKKVNELTRDRDRAVEEAVQLREALTSGDEAAAAAIAMLGAQANNYEAERIRLGAQLDDLSRSNAALKEEVQAEVRTVAALFEQLQSSTGAQEEVRGTVKEIRENLAGVVTCPICCERYGSLSKDMRRRPIHLSCGHIFCASCLVADWSTREQNGIMNPSRCFNRCTNFDPERLGEIYLLEDVGEVLDRLATY